MVGDAMMDRRTFNGAVATVLGMASLAAEAQPGSPASDSSATRTRRQIPANSRPFAEASTIWAGSRAGP
jgi:hypothetical protein